MERQRVDMLNDLLTSSTLNDLCVKRYNLDVSDI